MGNCNSSVSDKVQGLPAALLFGFRLIFLLSETAAFIFFFYILYIFFLYNFVAAAERKRLISAVKKTKDSRKYGDHAGDSIKLSLAAQNVLSTCGQISDCIWYLHSGDSSRYIYTFFRMRGPGGCLNRHNELNRSV